MMIRTCLVLLLCVIVNQCDARKSMFSFSQYVAARSSSCNSMKIVNQNLDSSNSAPYASSPFSMPPFDPLPSVSLPEPLPPLCPYSTISSPSPIDIIPGPPSPTGNINPPATFPSPSGNIPIPSYTFPGPPEFGPTPTIPGPTWPTLSPPYNEPNPPGLTPRPPIFEPPAPSVPPPPNGTPGTALWCVAKPSVPDPIIQEALNYACGLSADCGSIQPSGSCFQPDTLYAHASYAFNDYWQRNKAKGGTCEFGGTAMLVAIDPSYEGCHFLYN